MGRGHAFRDVFTAMESVHDEYQLMVLSEVVPDFRTAQELRGVFELAAECLAPAGQLLFNTFLPRKVWTGTCSQVRARPEGGPE